METDLKEVGITNRKYKALPDSEGRHKDVEQTKVLHGTVAPDTCIVYVCIYVSTKLFTKFMSET